MYLEFIDVDLKIVDAYIDQWRFHHGAKVRREAVANGVIRIFAEDWYYLDGSHLIIELHKIAKVKFLIWPRIRYISRFFIKRNMEADYTEKGCLIRGSLNRLLFDSDINVKYGCSSIYQFKDALLEAES